MDLNLIFKVNRPRLDHDGLSLGFGQPIALTAEQAAPLLKIGAVVELDGEIAEEQAAAIAQQKADEEAAALAKQKADEEAAQKKAQEDAAALEAQKKKDAAGATKGAAKG